MVRWIVEVFDGLFYTFPRGPHPPSGLAYRPLGACAPGCLPRGLHGSIVLAKPNLPPRNEEPSGGASYRCFLRQSTWQSSSGSRHLAVKPGVLDYISREGDQGAQHQPVFGPGNESLRNAGLCISRNGATWVRLDSNVRATLPRATRCRRVFRLTMARGPRPIRNTRECARGCAPCRVLSCLSSDGFNCELPNFGSELDV